MMFNAAARHALLTLAAVILCGALPRLGTAAPAFLSPADQASYSANQAFSWLAESDDSAYALTIGSAEGGRDVYDSGELAGGTSSHTASGLGGHDKLYARLWARSRHGAWSYSSITLLGGSAAQQPRITSPVAGSTLDGDSVALRWQGGSGVSRFWLYVGDSPGAREHLSRNMDTATAHTVTGLPTDGRSLWVRLWYFTDRWRYTDHQYHAAGDDQQSDTTPAIVAPVPGSLLTQPELTLRWQNNSYSPSNYWLYIGTETGASDIHSSGALGDANEYHFDALPTGLQSVHVRLWFFQDRWLYNDYHYDGRSYGGAQLIAPAPGSTLEQTSQRFRWFANGLAVDAYQLWLGRSAGASDIHDSGELGGAVLEADVPDLGQVALVHATLRHRVDGNWHESRASYLRPISGGFYDPFDSDIGRWQASKGSWQHAQSSYLATSVGNNWSLASYRGGDYGDLDFSVRVRRSDTEDNPTIVSVRDAGDPSTEGCWCANTGCYTFEITPVRSAAVWSCVNDRWTRLASLVDSPLIEPGRAWNELRVRALGPQLSFFINGELAWQGSDNSHASGAVGVGLVNFSDDDLIGLEVDWAQLSLPGSSRELAQDGSASQSSTGFGGDALRAIDGDRNGRYNDDSVTHTGFQARPWWQLDLGRQALLEQLRLFNREDCCSERLRDVHVFVADADMSSRSLNELQADPDVQSFFLAGVQARQTELSLGQLSGRYLRVQLQGTGYLSLAEVEVLGR